MLSIDTSRPTRFSVNEWRDRVGRELLDTGSAPNSEFATRFARRADREAKTTRGSEPVVKAMVRVRDSVVLPPLHEAEDGKPDA